MKDPSGRPGPEVSAKALNPWYTRSAVLVPGVLLLLYLFIYIYPLGYRPLAIPDETRYAEIPREMLATGDWITPRLNGLRYFEKPPMGYWLNAMSIALFGENEFAVRFPSALAAGITTLMVFLLALRISGRRRIAMAAAIIHMTFMEVYIVGVTSVLDNFLTLFLTAGIICFYLAATGSRSAPGESDILAGIRNCFRSCFSVQGIYRFCGTGTGVGSLDAVAASVVAASEKGLVGYPCGNSHRATLGGTDSSA